MPAPLPPGTPGLPFLGETLALLKNPYAFLAERRARFGPVFRSRILGREIVYLAGPDGMEAFLDADRVTRVGGHMPHVQRLFGGANINMFDGPKHLAMKTLLLTAFTGDALATYIPQVEGLVSAALERWAGAPEQAMEEELRRLAIEAIALNVLGLSPGPEVDALQQDYVDLTPGFLAAPIDFPGTPFARAVRAKDRLLARYQRLIAEHRAEPRNDALSIALAAVLPDGTRISDAEMVLELNHLVVAGYIVYALFAELLLQLSRAPELLAQARDEVARRSPAGPITLDALAGMPVLAHLVMEAKRTAPIVPFIFGTARRTFEHAGFTIPEGWGVQMAIPLSNRDPAVFAEPDRFDPARYAEPRCEHAKHAHGWMPQGSGPPTGHRCLGLEYSTVLTEVFLVHALRGYRWSLPPQDLGYRWTLIPAGFNDGLRMRFERLG